MGGKGSRSLKRPEQQDVEAPPEAGESNQAPPDPVGEPATSLLIVDAGAEDGAGAVPSRSAPSAPARQKKVGPSTKKARASGRRDGDARVRWVRVSGAGLNYVNGVYRQVADFNDAEMFIKVEEKRGWLFSPRAPSPAVHIRLQGEAAPHVWVITLSPEPGSGSDHLYKREQVRSTQATPPLMGWVAWTDGVPKDRADELAKGFPELEYYNFPPGSTEGKELGPIERGGSSPRSAPSMNLTVCIIGATNLPDAVHVAYDTYCVCEVRGKTDVIETPPAQGSNNPEWMFTSPLESWEPNDDLHFAVYIDSGVAIGEATLGHDRLRGKGFVGEIPLMLLDSSDNNDPDAKLSDSNNPDAKLNICITMPGQAAPDIEVELLEEPNATMGIDIAPEWSQGSFSIRKIREGGLVHKWNQAHPDRRVMLRDRVVGVNGKSGSCHDLLSSLTGRPQRTRTTKLLIQRNTSR